VRSAFLWALLIASPAPLQADTPPSFTPVPLKKAEEVPFVKLPAEIKAEVNDIVVLRPETNGTEVQYVVLDKGGLTLFPGEELKNPKNAIIIVKAGGRYRVLAYTAAKDKASQPTIVTIVAGNAPPIPPPVPGPEPAPAPGPDPGPAPNPSPRPAGFAGECYDQLKAFPRDELAVVASAIKKVLSNTAYHADAYPRIKKIMEANELPQSRWSGFVAWYKDKAIAMYEADGSPATVQEQVTALTSWQYAAEALSR
jgi:hypothetical protein